MVLKLSDGRLLEYQNNRSATQVSTQREFFERLETTFGHSNSAAEKVGKRNWTGLIATAVGLVLALGYVLYRLYGR